MKDFVTTALIVPTLIVAVLVISSEAKSHHSHAMFDHSREVTFTGTVASYSFRNPHVYLYLDVEGEGGDVARWSVEMSNIENMVRRGLRASTFKAGDVVTVTVNPLDNGNPGGNYVTVTAADGTTYD